MASIVNISNLLDEIQQPLYIHATNARTNKLIAIQKAANELRKAQLECVGRKYVYKLMTGVRFGRVNYRTFYKLVDILRVHETSAYFILHHKILDFVTVNKYKARWFIVFLMKLRHKRDGNTKHIQDVFIKRYLSPKNDLSARIDSTFLNMFVQEYPSFDRTKLFRHLVNYKNAKDSYGKNVLSTFFEICPEYSKYAILE